MLGNEPKNVALGVAEVFSDPTDVDQGAALGGLWARVDEDLGQGDGFGDVEWW